MFQINNYINAPVACIAIAVIAAVFAFSVILYTDFKTERDRKRRVIEAKETGRVVVISNEE